MSEPVAQPREAPSDERGRLLAAVDAARREAAANARLMHALQHITAAFASAVTPELVAEVVSRAGVDAAGASGGVLYVMRDARLHPIHFAYPERAHAVVELALDRDSPVSEAVRRREPVWVPDSQALRTRYPQLIEAAQLGSVWQAHVALPLVVEGELLGALAFSWREPNTFDIAQQEFLTAIANQCAQALGRAALFEREREARAHTERSAIDALRLERITGALGEVVEPVQVIDRFLERGLTELDAPSGAVLLLDDLRRSLEVVGSRSAALTVGTVVAVDEDLPAADAVRNRTIALDEGTGRQGEQLRDATAAVPLIAYGTVLGVLVADYGGPRRFDADDRAFLERVGARLAEALERSRLYQHERESRARAESAARRLRSVQGLAAALARSATRRQIAQAFVEHLRPAAGADLVFVAALSSDRRTIELLTPSDFVEIPVTELDGTLEHVVRDALTRGRVLELNSPDEVRAMFPIIGEWGIQSLVLQPMRAVRSLLGVLGMGWRENTQIGPEGRSLLAIAASLGGPAFDRATTYELDHQIAETLQRHLLTAPSTAVRGIQWAARYAPGRQELTAGGDWYDVIGLAGGRVGVAVGDIVGHGIVAAAAMGQIRSATRALASREDPAGLLEALDEYALTTDQGYLSSLAYLVIDRVPHRLQYAVAGHPPPLIRHPDGHVEIVEHVRGPLLGLAASGSRRSFPMPFEAGSTLVLYTDGLVERRGESIDAGLARLQDAVRSTPRELHPEGLCDVLLHELADDARLPDDVTLLVVHIDDPGPLLVRQYPARLDMLRVIRAETRDWLDANGVSSADDGDLLVAIGEACANAIEHGAGVRAHERIGYRLEITADTITATISDAGTWIERQRRGLRGHGLAIMQAMVDEVDVARDETGTTVTLRRHRR